MIELTLSRRSDLPRLGFEFVRVIGTDGGFFPTVVDDIHVLRPRLGSILVGLESSFESHAGLRNTKKEFAAKHEYSSRELVGGS